MMSGSQAIELVEIRADNDSTKDIVYSEENFANTSGDKFDSQIREAEGADGYHSVLHSGQSDSDDGEEQPAGCSNTRKKYFAYRVKESEEVGCDFIHRKNFSCRFLLYLQRAVISKR